MKYRAEIDGLRALAVLPVMFFHAGFPGFSGGFVGVDVFFVISGYLISTIIISEMAEGKFSIVTFYERRARRILPPLFFVMTACLPFAWLLLTPNDLKDFGQSLVAVSTFSSNFLFWLESGYFDSSGELKPLLHTWSLAVEEQYYILFPIFLMLTWRLGFKWILGLLILLFLLSLGFAHWSAFNMPSAGFYLLPTRVWELLIGVFAAFYLKYNTHSKTHSVNQILSLLGLSLIIYAIVIFDDKTPFPSLYALVPTLGTALLIISAVPNTLAHKLMSFSPIVGIGLISYSAYLWHQPLFAFARHQQFGQTSDLLLAMLFFISILFAWFSWRYVEKPFRDKTRTTQLLIFSFSLSGIIIMSLIGGFLHLSKGVTSRVSFSDELSSSLLPPSLDNCIENLVPDSTYQKGSTVDNWGCYIGTQKPNIDFIVFGDSHSLSLISLLDKIGKERNISIFHTGSSGCLPFIGIYADREALRVLSNQKKNNCHILNRNIMEIAKKNPIKGIILSARWTSYISSDSDLYGRQQMISLQPDGPYSLEGSMQAFRSAFNNTLDQYNQLKIPVHLISQPPQQKFSPERAYFKVAKGLSTIENLSMRRPLFEKLEKFQLEVFSERSHDFNFYHAIDNFCDDKICLIGSADVSYYYDDNHLSSPGALKLRPFFQEIFDIHRD